MDNQLLLQQNYLGAIFAVTSLFGARAEPAAARHEAIMRYLEANFTQVNKPRRAAGGGSCGTSQLVVPDPPRADH